nr:glycosyl hydrolase-related protein [Marinicella sp. W31]MDC2877284.1 glycosyl hydrolase-related protein [Marinicella sp. W31]
MSVDNAAIGVEAVKRSEDGEGLVVRLWERHGAGQKVRLAFGNVIAQVCEVDLLEEPIAVQTVEGGVLDLAFTPFEIRTLKLKRRDKGEGKAGQSLFLAANEPARKG